MQCFIGACFYRASLDTLCLQVCVSFTWKFEASGRWAQTPPALKLRAIEAQDPNIARPTVAEATMRNIDAIIKGGIEHESTLGQLQHPVTKYYLTFCCCE